ncbi:MAG: NAD(P)H-dependent oxidoreductase [Planctomycetes bacterium]|nr:NAD(P)H-dependent oxidoreductase [Planctomycetota bacterium]
MEPTTSPDQLLRCLQWRYATKRFDPTRRIPDATWQALEQALVLAPSSFGLQPWKFVVVDDPALRTALRAQSWNQSQVTDAHRYVVIAALRTTNEHDVDRFLQRTAEVRGTPIESMAGYGKVIKDFLVKGWAAKDLFGWNARQAYIALGQLMTAAALLGVDTCPMEGIDANGYDRVLGLHGSRYATLCACALGYRAADDKYATAPKVRYAPDQVIERR